MPRNRWMAMVGHRGCIFPCSGEPVLKTGPDGPWVAAHELPVFLQCSVCGYAPLPEVQPDLIKAYNKAKGRPTMRRVVYGLNGKKGVADMKVGVFDTREGAYLTKKEEDVLRYPHNGWKGPFAGAWRKGRDARKSGAPKKENPYRGDTRNWRGGLTWKRAWWKAWEDGWECAAQGLSHPLDKK